MERRTRQRDAIRAAFSKAARPLAVQEAHSLAMKSVPGLGIATVYRNIKALVDEGALEAVELPGEAPRYEASGLAHHHHFRCNRCERVFDVPGCPGAMKALVPRGFRLDAHDLLLYGRCAQCA